MSAQPIPSLHICATPIPDRHGPVLTDDDVDALLAEVGRRRSPGQPMLELVHSADAAEAPPPQPGSTRPRGRHAGRPVSDVGTAPESEWIAKVVVAVLEVSTGRRPIGPLTRWLSPEVHRSLQRRAVREQTQRGPRRPIRVRRVRRCVPAQGVTEAAVTVDDGGRVRAVAVRFVVLHDRWVVEALEAG